MPVLPKNFAFLGLRVFSLSALSTSFLLVHFRTFSFIPPAFLGFEPNRLAGGIKFSRKMLISLFRSLRCVSNTLHGIILSSYIVKFDSNVFSPSLRSRFICVYAAYAKLNNIYFLNFDKNQVAFVHPPTIQFAFSLSLSPFLASLSLIRTESLTLLIIG